MAYALASAYASATLIHPVIKTSWFTKTTKGDAVKFQDEAGIVPLNLGIVTNGASGVTSQATEGWSYGIIRVDGAADSVADTTINYDTGSLGAETTSGGYFIRNPSTGEIMYVVSDSGAGKGTGTGSLVVVRGALGTTAATIADNQYLEVMNVLHLYGEGTGNEWIVYLSLGTDPRAAMW